MPITLFPKIKIDITAGDKGVVEVDGVPVSGVQSVGFNISAGKIAQVVLTIAAEVLFERGVWKPEVSSL